MLDVAPGSRSAAIVAATRRPDKVIHVEVVEHRRGVDWVVERCAELKVHRPLDWVVDPAGPVLALLPALAEAGIDPTRMTTRDLGQACEQMVSAIGGRRVAHVDDPLLNAAVEGADRRDIGDGLWAWSRRKSTVDISPIVAATGASWRLAATADYDVMGSFW